MNHIKTVILAGTLLCAIVFSFGNFSSGTPAAEARTTPDVSGVTCSTFCQSEGGPFYLNIGATSETTCTQKGGDWFPDSGCCCKCSEPGRCL